MQNWSLFQNIVLMILVKLWWRHSDVTNIIMWLPKLLLLSNIIKLDGQQSGGLIFSRYDKLQKYNLLSNLHRDNFVQKYLRICSPLPPKTMLLQRYQTELFCWIWCPQHYEWERGQSHKNSRWTSIDAWKWKRRVKQDSIVSLFLLVIVATRLSGLVILVLISNLNQ